MDLAGFVLFTSTLFLAAVSPGPGITALVARVLGRGPWEAIPFSIGMAVGSVIWLTCSVVGLAAVAQAFHWIFLVIQYLGAAYLLYLAYKLWTSPGTMREVRANQQAEHPLKLFLGGIALTLGNPKSIMFYLALLPTFIDLNRITVLAYAELVATVLIVLGSVFSGYILLAARARRFFTSPRAIRVLNRATGTMMAGAAAAVAAR